MKIDIQIEFYVDVSGEAGEAFMDSILDHIRLSALRRGLSTLRLMAQMAFPPIKPIPRWPA